MLHGKAAVAIERDGPNPSEFRTRLCYLACPGCSRNGELPRRAGCERDGTKGIAPWRTERRSRWRRRAPSRRRTGTTRCCWDSAAPGLGLRAQPSGHKSWIVHRRCNGSVVRRTLGPLDAVTVEDGRHATRTVIAEAEAGDAVTTVPTVRAFARTFLADCTERWKHATRESYADTVRRWILSAFGNRPVDATGAKNVRTRHDSITATRPGSANWALAAMSWLMKHVETLGLRPKDSNPCRGLRRHETGFEAHYVTDDEFAALGQTLDDAESEHPVAVTALRFLPYTGARKSEALRLRWEGVHGERAVLAALARRDDCPWVFASPARESDQGGHGMEGGSRSGGVGDTPNTRTAQLARGGRSERRRGPSRGRRAARSCRHLDHVRLCTPCGGFGVRRRDPGLARSCRDARRQGGGP